MSSSSSSSKEREEHQRQRQEKREDHAATEEDAPSAKRRRTTEGVPAWLQPEMDRMEGDPATALKQCFPESRVRKLMKGDGMINMVSQLSPLVCGKACELFIMRLTAAAVARLDATRRTVTKDDVAAVLREGLEFDFLQAGVLAAEPFVAGDTERAAKATEAADSASSSERP